MALNIESNVDLLPFNTFHVKASAKFLVRIQRPNDIHELIASPVFKSNRSFILGGGSNILFLNDFDGLVIKAEEKSINIASEGEDDISIDVSSGMVWNDLVMSCLAKNWGGLENLSLIPGTVGAAPIQNIGAYGVEIKSLVDKVNGIDLSTGAHRTLTNSECRFSYRDSIFKHELRENFFVSSITLRLRKKNHHINYQYDALKQSLVHSNTDKPTIQDISESVIKIRQSKLPDPANIGNAGSFFKNPVVSEKVVHDLKKQWPTIPVYPFEYQSFKIPAGWLIENCNWKGKRIGRAGVHEHQALVIVNHDQATGEEIFKISQTICDDVYKKFGITLTREVNVIK